MSARFLECINARDANPTMVLIRYVDVDMKDKLVDGLALTILRGITSTYDEDTHHAWCDLHRTYVVLFGYRDRRPGGRGQDPMSDSSANVARSCRDRRRDAITVAASFKTSTQCPRRRLRVSTSVSHRGATNTRICQSQIRARARTTWRVASMLEIRIEYATRWMCVPHDGAVCTLRVGTMRANDNGGFKTSVARTRGIPIPIAPVR